MASTWLAIDRQSKKKVACKVLSLQEIRDWKILELFRREIAVLKNLDHPQIPDYIDDFDLKIEDDVCYVLVQEYVEGDNLYQLVKNGKRFSAKEARGILISLLQILDSIHQLKPPVIHRDIQPKNIIIDRSGRVFLVDFSAAGTIRRTTEAAARSDTFVGTIGYMPPEQYYGKVVPQSDLYSLGITMIFILTGKEPSEFELAQLKLDYAADVSLPDDIKQILDLLIEPDIADRPSSAQEALELLEQYSLIRETAVKRRQGPVALGEGHNLFRFHLTSRVDCAFKGKALQFLVNAIELVFNRRGDAYFQSGNQGRGRNQCEWESYDNTPLNVKITVTEGKTRIDARQNAFFGGTLAVLVIYAVFLNMFLLGAVTDLGKFLFETRPFEEYFYLFFLGMTAAEILLYMTFKGIRGFATLRQSLLRLTAILGLFAEKREHLNHPEILFKRLADALPEGKKRSRIDIHHWTRTKWRADVKKNRHAPADIQEAAETVLAKKKGSVKTAGMCLRWTHPKAAGDISFLSRGTGTDIEFHVDRRNYWIIYGIFSFFTTLSAWFVWFAFLVPRVGETDLHFLSGLTVSLVIAPFAGMIINFFGSLIHYRTIKKQAVKLVNMLEELSGN